MLQIIQKRIYAYAFSILVTLVSIVVLFLWGLNFGIDFRGGTLMEVRFALSPVPEVQTLGAALAPLDLKSLTIQPTAEGRSCFAIWLPMNQRTKAFWRNSKALTQR
ncbi:MAG: hypothetical protein WDN67_04085 [Candidatus Moraniibacteriota bacterium]